jgi:Fe-S oxidoreductase
MSVVPLEKKSLDVLAPGAPNIDYELVLDCVHCGLCTSACPTYVENGHEADSPRGRIYLMRNVIDGQLALDDTVKEHLDLCLNCRACETACPSGVQYGKLIEPFREYMATAVDWTRLADANERFLESVAQANARDARDAPRASSTLWLASRLTARRRPTASASCPLSRLRCRRDLPRDPGRDGSRSAKERL